MDTIVAFDIGGSAVKYGFWIDNQLKHQSSFVTPETMDEMIVSMKDVINSAPKEVKGVAISSPGAVNADARVIEGISAVPYLHDFPIYDRLEKEFNLPVTIENDANCAGIAEMALGAGEKANNAVFIVLGTGVGGAIFINGKIYKGSHLFGGEFGLLKNKTDKILSMTGTIVKVANRYEELTGEKVTGKEIFALVDEKNELAIELVKEMYDDLAQSLYNIQVSIDPELVMIGGGVSEREELPVELSKRLKILLDRQGVGSIMPEIVACQFKNDANLIGAVMNFIQNS